MSEESEGFGEGSITTLVVAETTKHGDDQGQLLVAMQPGVEIPAIGVEEVVVVTEGDTDGVIGHVELETTVVDGSTQEITLATAEEIIEDVKPFTIKRRSLPNTSEFYDVVDDGAYARRSMVYQRQGIQASKGPPPESSGESGSEDSSSEHQMMYSVSPSKKDPKKREFAYRLQWRGKDMLDAMRSVEEKQMTIRGAAKKFMVPYSTLKDRVHGRVRHGTKPGVKTALSPEEEEELVRYIKDMEAAGFLMRNADLRERAGELLRLNYGHSSPYGEGSSPGHNWLSGFLKRHQGIEFRRQAARAIVPSCSRQRQYIKKFFDVTSQVYKKNRLATKPERIYVVSEMKMAVFQKATVIYSASAAGTAVPPFVIFKGQQKLKLTSAREAYPQAFFTSSPQGVVTEEIFLWWFRDHFLKAIPHVGNRPLVLFISQPCNNISLQMYQLAKEERVIFISIPRGVAHLLQPLDDELGEYIEGCLSKKVKKWESLNSGSIFNQKVLGQLLQKVWRKVFTVDEIASKYNKVGIYPLNPSAISTDKILAMSHAMRESMRRSTSSPPPNDEDDAAQGLSLLSALSSHEYASAGQNHAQFGSQDNLQTAYDHEEETSSSHLLEEFETPTTSEPPAKRLRMEEESPDIFNRDMEPVLKEVVQRVMTERGKTVKLKEEKLEEFGNGTQVTKVENQPLDVQSEIALARENLDQINRAVDSILGSEPTTPSSSVSAVSSRSSPRRSVGNNMPRDFVRTDKMRIVRPSSRPRASPKSATTPAAAAQSKRSANILSRGLTAKVVAPPPKKTVVQPSRPGKQSTQKIILMLNKDGQLVSHTQLSEGLPVPSLHTHQSHDNLKTTAEELQEVVEEPVEDVVVYNNIKTEGTDQQNNSQILEEHVQTIDNPAAVEQIIYTTTDNTFVTTGSDIDSSYAIGHGVTDEQPPQNILQDEELDLESVDTILINGQLFKVIRPQNSNLSSDVKQEEAGDSSGRASVIHQEVVQDYEVSSFEQVTAEEPVELDVIEEHVI